ncbi:hypothetical protein AAHA92_06748 [Salvia divinorum]|uniref:Myb/SANT-like domain-containing protein n=1 Tax=Salvia divinorum TaxID=28513 RepID=A0ABD1I9N7_SALDI
MSSTTLGKFAGDGSPSGLRDGGSMSKVKGDRTRRSWSKREEEVTKSEMPDTQLLVNPHINSKITTWKRCYNSLLLILDHSGIGFNSDNDFKIECNDEQWSQIVKWADINAKYMHYKSWPYLEDWKAIFEKDRAIGVRTEDVSCADDILYGKDASVADESQPNLSPYHLDDFFTEEQIQEGLNVDPTRTSTNFVYTHGYDFDLSAKRVEVSKMLEEIPLLPQKHRFMACDILVKELERLDLFTRFSMADKYDYVLRILEEQHGI